MARYRFKWTNLPPQFLAALCRDLELYVDEDGPAAALRAAYGARPTEDFIREAWPTLRERWLRTSKESRDWIVDSLREARGEPVTVLRRDDQMEYLRSLRVAKNLRRIVWQEFVAVGEIEPEPHIADTDDRTSAPVRTQSRAKPSPESSVRPSSSDTSRKTTPSLAANPARPQQQPRSVTERTSSMTTSVHDVFEAFRKASNNYERGAKFEKLMAQYLPLDPVYGRRFDQVWLWKDWPGRSGKVDTGIDLVAHDAETDGLWAIQCKFYEPEHTVAKADIDSFLSASGKHPFTNRLIISTTDRWGKHAEDACDDQQIPVQRIGLADIAESPIDWAFAGPEITLEVDLAPAPKHEPRPHQAEAIDEVLAGFAAGNDRGKLIMACGTGKTFTALKIAERVADEHHGAARVLFLVPSISLLSQTLREWTAQCQLDLRSFAVCSDTKVSRAVEDINPHDVPLPATTDPTKLIAQMQHRKRAKGLTVVFSTYQSIGVIADAQDQGLDEFDLIICDEAHRTTGVTLADADESNFVKVHDGDFIRARRRLYMTATPRLFAEETKNKATEHDAVLASMDDESLYGPQFHRLGFGEAVERGLLTDYKVLVLTVDETAATASFQRQLADANQEINLEDAAKIVGCWNGLAKRTGVDVAGSGFGTDIAPMQRAVAFLRDIKTSKKLAEKFEAVIDAYQGSDDEVLRCEVEHVDGTYNALERNHLLQWLKAPLAENRCRILSNARCLSEGVDVPGLDAVLFLNPRNSVVDVVQSVGRVMRLAPGKQYGYIILPVVIPAGISPEDALADNQRFKVVWQVLQALRAHDDRFNATVNKLELNKKKAAESILVGHVGAADEAFGEDGEQATGKADATETHVAQQLALFDLEEWRDAIFAKIVDKVGTRTYWEDWATDVADIARAQQTRIQALLNGANAAVTAAFAKFVEALKANLNDSIDERQAIEMLSQHLITKPVFDALFEGYDFATHNPVSQVMQSMVNSLHDQALESETERLEGFYESVRMRAAGIDNAEGKQRIIKELYEKFFRTGFKTTATKLGVVYTPIEIVDFIIRSVDEVLADEFSTKITAQGVHVLDPFTGTGTFIVRLLQSGLIEQADLLRKYTKELHANEIILLAYYISAINIEATFHAAHGGEYTPFEGVVLTDTFQISEDGDTFDSELFPQNNDRILKQIGTPIKVIVGNPPYSSGQDSGNDNRKNQIYPSLDRRIAETYIEKSAPGNKNNLYNNYIRAFRWASDRIEKDGVVAFVSAAGYLDGNSLDGMRLSLAEEFSTIYIFNLRGNQRTAGELSKREGGKIFGSGSRNTVAIFIGVKNSASTGDCRILYRDIGDYLTREQKLEIVRTSDLLNIDWTQINPNENGDWISRRTDTFARYQLIGQKPKKGEVVEQTIFGDYSTGLDTSRDAWVYNWDKQSLLKNVETSVQFFNAEVARFTSNPPNLRVEGKKREAIILDFVNRDSTKISWGQKMLIDVSRGKKFDVDPHSITTAVYRPFIKQYCYMSSDLNHSLGRLRHFFPSPETSNIGFYVVNPGSSKPFSVLMLTSVPDRAFWGSNAGQFFPRWTYKQRDSNSDQLRLDQLPEASKSEYERSDNITDSTLIEYRAQFGDYVEKDDIFYYVYGVLHSPQYRNEFVDDLKKSLPRIPKASTKDDFNRFVQAGRKLATLHAEYEKVDPYPLKETIKGALGQSDRDLYRISKMRFKSKADKSTLVYNSHISLVGIPDDAHRYLLGSQSAIEWLIDRFQVKVDPSSGIVNDPNEWCDEHDDPRYILDLVKRIVTVSVETMEIVDNLPQLDLGPTR